MAGSNMFERFVEEERLAEQQQLSKAQEQHEEAERIRAEKMAIREMQDNLDSQQFGVKPSEVWGAEAEDQCLQFMDYLDSNFTPSQQRNVTEVLIARAPVRQLVRTFPKKYADVPKIKWSMQGFPIAYDDLARIAAYRIRIAENLPRRPQDVILSDVTLPDVFLCKDGLLRRGGGKSLRVKEAIPKFFVPKIGRLAPEYAGSEIETIEYGENTPAWTQVRHSVQIYEVRFNPMSLEDKLKELVREVIRLA